MITKEQQVAIEEAAKLYSQEMCKTDHFTEIREYCYTDFRRGAEEVLNNTEKYALAPANQWISIEDLPKKSGWYLVHEKNEKPFTQEQPMNVVFFNVDTEQFIDCGLTIEITHWQPLPQPLLKPIEE